jgi:energy-converting hydrogenase Eha subunit G
MMVNIIIGAFLMTGLLFLIDYVRRNKLRIQCWKWIITILGFFYVLFILEMIVSFLSEGAVKAALVMGTILGLLAVVWGVLLGRFVFARKTQ